MRRLLILLMIVLLPMRAWAGEAMGIQMASNMSASQLADAMPPDCPMHAQAGSSHEAFDANSEQTSQGVAHCASCDVCTPMAVLAASASFDIVVVGSHAPPIAGCASFVSATLPQTVKPPIF